MGCFNKDKEFKLVALNFPVAINVNKVPGTLRGADVQLCGAIGAVQVNKRPVTDGIRQLAGVFNAWSRVEKTGLKAGDVFAVVEVVGGGQSFQGGAILVVQGGCKGVCKRVQFLKFGHAIADFVFVNGELAFFRLHERIFDTLGAIETVGDGCFFSAQVNLDVKHIQHRVKSGTVGGKRGFEEVEVRLNTQFVQQWLQACFEGRLLSFNFRLTNQAEIRVVKKGLRRLPNGVANDQVGQRGDVDCAVQVVCKDHGQQLVGITARNAAGIEQHGRIER